VPKLRSGSCILFQCYSRRYIHLVCASDWGIVKCTYEVFAIEEVSHSSLCVQMVVGTWTWLDSVVLTTICDTDGVEVTLVI
jgi:hypothetical protein